MGEISEGLIPNRLTPGQLVVLQWIADGKRNDEIAMILETTVWAVEAHAVRIMDRLGANTRAGAVAFALRRGIIK